jgi:hypothetical protein
MQSNLDKSYLSLFLIDLDSFLFMLFLAYCISFSTVYCKQRLRAKLNENACLIGAVLYYQTQKIVLLRFYILINLFIFGLSDFFSMLIFVAKYIF